MQPRNEPLTYSVAEAAEALGIGLNATYELVNSGRVKSFKIGRKIRVPREGLVEFIRRASGVRQ